jgi:hypothetical protein
MFDESVSIRFWAKVDKNGPTMPHMQTPCWMWTASKKSNGYGQLILKKGVLIQAHRLSYMLAHGDIPSGLLVCHECDNPACVRADHLFLGTHKDNMQDSVKKGRKTKYTPEQIKERRANAQKIYEAENRERLLQGQKRYREQNKEREKERKRAWYEQNRDRVRAHQKEYHQSIERPEPKTKSVTIRSLRLSDALYAEINHIRGDASILDVIVQLIEDGLKSKRREAA